MITKLFAVDLATDNIKVFEIRPGVIDTDMISSVKEKYKALAEEGKFPSAESVMLKIMPKRHLRFYRVILIMRPERLLNVAAVCTSLFYRRAKYAKI